MTASPPSDDLALRRAIACLESAGMQVLDRRWRAPGNLGEASIVAARKHTLVICDLKIFTDRGRGDITRMAKAKVRRLRRIAVAWMTAHGARYDQVSIDAIWVVWEGPGGYSLTHVQEVG